MNEALSAQEDRSYWRALYAATRDITSSLDLEEVLSRLVRRVAEAMHVKAASLRLLAPNGDSMMQRTSFGLSAEYLAKGPVNLGHSSLDRETLQGAPVWVEDVRTDPRFQYPAEAVREGLVSALCVPVTAQGRHIGVLRVYTAEPRRFDTEEVEFLSALADLGAIAIENARLHEELQRDYDQTLGALWGVDSVKS